VCMCEVSSETLSLSVWSNLGWSWLGYGHFLFQSIDLWELTYYFFTLQCLPTAWLYTVAPLWRTRAKRKKSILTLSLLNPSTLLYISVTTSSTQR
jgi:hypothetical protein